MGDAEEQRKLYEPGKPEDPCKLISTEFEAGKASIHCSTHEVWALGTFRRTHEAYAMFRCDRGRNLRFILTDPNPIKQDRFASQFTDLTDLVRILSHEYEDSFYGSGDPTSWNVWQLHTDTAYLPVFTACSVRCVDFGHWDDNDYKWVEWEVKDSEGEILTTFTIRLDGRA